MAGRSGLPDLGEFEGVVVAAVKLVAARERVEKGELLEAAAVDREQALLEACRELLTVCERAPGPGEPGYISNEELEKLLEEVARKEGRKP